jgi:glucose/mannose-6-phosphate isomerase
VPGDAPDSLGLRAAALATPETAAAAAALVGDAGVAGRLPARNRIEALLLLGAGEGATSARVVSAVAEPLLPVPLVRSSDFGAPGFASETTLVLALSWDEEHDEIIEACTGGLAPRAPLVVIGGAGVLAEAAAARGGAVVPLPPGIPVARAAVAPLVTATVTLLEAAGLFPGAGPWVDEAVAQLTRRRDEVAGATEPFGALGRLARRIAGTMPLVQGAGPIGAAASAALAARVRLDAKAPAWWSSVPALAHDEIAGWGQHGDVTRQVISAVQLRHDHEHPALDARFAALNDLQGEVLAGIHELRAAGDGALAQALDLVLQGDLLALALAAAAGLDPGPQGVRLSP